MYSVDERPMHEIAKALGVSIWKVHDTLHKNGVDIRPRMTDRCKEAAIRKNRHRKQTKEERQKRSEKLKRGGIGAKKKSNTGYMYVYFPDHPCAKDGWIAEHRLVMEALIGRRLKHDEVVHHINGKRTDNRKENLMLMSDKEHRRFHMKERYANERDSADR